MLEIRAFEKEDIKECAELLNKTFSREPWEDRWTQDKAEAYLGEYCGNSRFAGFVISVEGKLAGAAFCRAKTWWTGDELYIDEFYISPDHQREGLGAALMTYIEGYAGKKGLSCITLLTNNHTPAFDFYNKNGFNDLPNMVFMHKAIRYNK